MMDPSMDFVGARLQRVEGAQARPPRGPAPVFLGHSPAARRVQGQIHRAVGSAGSVLLIGPRGAGKHTVARILHHFAGAEAGADTDGLEFHEAHPHLRLGRFPAMAYVSPIEQLSLEEQARIPSLAGEVRLVLGSELDPESEEGRRRLEPRLLRWIGESRIVLQRLAERIEDLEPLALSILLATPTHRPVAGISDAALDCLRSYPWPGELDELVAVLGDALRAGTSELVELRDLPARLRVRDLRRVRIESPERSLCLEEAERQAIRRALHYAHGNKRKAARLLHIGKTTLYRKLKAYDLE